MKEVEDSHTKEFFCLYDTMDIQFNIAILDLIVIST